MYVYDFVAIKLFDFDFDFDIAVKELMPYLAAKAPVWQTVTLLTYAPHELAVSGYQLCCTIVQQWYSDSD